MSKKYLITGATGFVGSCLVRRLLDNHNEVHIVSRKFSDTWRIKDIENFITVHYTNLYDETQVKDLLYKNSFNTIIHLATYGGYSFQKDNNNIINTNILIPWNLLKFCKETNVEAFINTSSSSEYGEKFEPMKENMMLEPNNIYGASKAASTLLTSTYSKINEIPLCTFRLFSPYGYYDDKSRLIPTVINCALQNKEIYLSSKTSKRDFIFIDDVIDAYITVDNCNKYGKIYNLGSGKEYTVEEIVNKIIYLTNSKSIVHWNNTFKERQYEPANWCADISKFKDEYLWSPKTNIEEGLIKTIKWMEKNKNFYY